LITGCDGRVSAAILTVPSGDGQTCKHFSEANSMAVSIGDGCEGKFWQSSSRNWAYRSTASSVNTRFPRRNLSLAEENSSTQGEGVTKK